MRTTLGSFQVVRDRDHPTGGEIAVRQDGPVLLGAGEYLRRMVDAVDGRVTTVSRDPLHAALRRSIGSDGAMVASWMLPPDWLERATGSALVRLSPLAGVRAAALRLDVSPTVQLGLVVGCASPAACQQVVEAVAEVKRTASPLLPPGSFGQSVADRVEVTALASEVRLGLTLTQQEASDALRQLLASLTAVSPPASMDSTVLPIPDEVVRPQP
jgi:hypothetical protein